YDHETDLRSAARDFEDLAKLNLSASSKARSVIVKPSGILRGHTHFSASNRCFNRPWGALELGAPDEKLIGFLRLEPLGAKLIGLPSTATRVAELALFKGPGPDHCRRSLLPPKCSALREGAALNC